VREGKAYQAIVLYKHKPYNLAPLPPLTYGAGVVWAIATKAAIQMEHSEESVLYAEFAVS